MRRWPGGLFGHISTSLIAVFSVAMLVMAAVMINVADQRFDEERLNMVTASARTLAEGSLDALASQDYELLENWVHSILLTPAYAYAYLARANGQILTHTDVGQVAHYTEPVGEIQGVQRRELSYQGRPVREIIYPAYLGNRHLANAHVAYYLDQDPFAGKVDLWRIIGYVAVTAIIMLAITLLIVRHNTSPITELTEYVTTLSLEELHHRLHSRILSRKDEVGELARAFDAMAVRLTAAVDELKNNEQNLRNLVEERTRSLTEINSELRAFSSAVSHDLRAPLRAVGGFARILEEDHATSLDEDGRHCVERILTGVQRMNNLIDDMLALSHIAQTRLEKKNINLSAICEQVAGQLQEANPPLHIDFCIEENVYAWGDASLMQIAMENLLGNAVKYSSKRETISIEFGCEDNGEEPVYYIRDNGIGFDMKYAGMLFLEFKRLHGAEEYEGTGIGLATVARIISRHGGQIRAEAEPGQGATFYFTLSRPG